MLDATQLSYLTIVKWDNPPAKWEHPPAENLGEELSCSTTLSVDLVDEMSAAQLMELLSSQAIDAWRYKIEQRMGEPPPNDARLAVTVLVNATTGMPVAHLCTLVEDEADEATRSIALEPSPIMGKIKLAATCPKAEGSQPEASPECSTPPRAQP